MTLSMKPPYDITTSIIELISSISEKIGQVNAIYLVKQSPQLRKQNRIKTIHSSLQIEGNALTQEQITAIVENKRVLAPQKDIIEVINAIKVYDKLKSFKPYSEKSFLEAHRLLMHGLVENNGKYRTNSVGIVKGSQLKHLAPPADNLPFLMKDLFDYLKKIHEIPLLKACVFHYEMEFIHPFLDGNGRMGRLWQTVILMNEYPVFEFLPIETIISQTQENYYKALSISDKQGKSTVFIIYMLEVIDKALSELLKFNNRILSDIDRLEYFLEITNSEFKRNDYMNIFKDISTATASRDLKKGIELNLITKSGDKNKTIYKPTSK
jgi:Fic family protein